MSLSIDNFEIFLLIIVRISTFVYTAPILSLKNIPQKVKIGLSLFISIVIANSVPITSIEYDGIIKYATLVIKEAVAGALMGYFANISYYILAFVGQQIDQGIGFSMANVMDPITKIQVTITSNFYGYMVLLMMLITNLHHYFIYAIVDSFKLVHLGNVNIDFNIYNLMLKFVINYFIIGFRITLPIFASILIVNIVMAVLAKVAPQMNLFAIGIQLKLIIGLIILTFMIAYIPAVTDFIFNDMMNMLKSSMEYFVN